MAFLLKATAHVRMFKLIASSDHLSKLTGGSPTVNISKNGGSFGAAAGSVAEVADGWYSVTLSTVDTGTTGDLAYYITCASADDTDFCDQVVDPAVANLGVNLVNILGTVASTPATAGILDVNVKNMNNVAGTAITTIKAVQGLTTADTIATYTGNTPQTGDAYARLGAPAGASTAADIAAINAKTTNLPATPASATNITAGTITTVTNLTNAPTAGDFTATMKTSIGTAVAASAVASVTGNVGGNVVGSVGSVTGAVGSVTGAVGSVTGNVGGTVTGSVGSISGITFPTNFSALSIDSNGRVKVLTGLTKNVALAGFTFVMTDSTNHAPATGLTVTGTVRKDSGSFGSLTNAVSEVSAGFYAVDLAAGDLNGNVVELRFTATGADDTPITIVTNA